MASGSNYITSIRVPGMKTINGVYKPSTSVAQDVDITMNWTFDESDNTLSYDFSFNPEAKFSFTSPFIITVSAGNTTHNDNVLLNDGIYVDVSSIGIFSFTVDISGCSQLDISASCKFSGTYDWGGVDGYPGHNRVPERYFDWSGSISNAVSLYTAPTLDSFTINSSTTDSVNLTVKWTAGSESITTYEAYTTNNEDGWVSISNDVETTMNNLQPNTYYSFEAKISDGTTELTLQTNYWTYPKVENLVLTLKQSLEHDQIDARVSAVVSSPYDQFAFNLQSTSWSAWGGGNLISHL